MFSDLAAIRTAVRERLEPILPDEWKWETSVADAPQKALVPVVYLEFVRIESAPDGQPLGPGSAGARFNLIVATPSTAERGEDDADDCVHRLVSVLEHTPDLYWSDATKLRLDDGRLAWRIDVLALTLTPTPEP